MAEIGSAKRHRGTVRARLTRIKKDIGKCEEKEELSPSDVKKIRRLKELAKELDCEFEECHVEVLNFIAAEDTAALAAKEAVFDEHGDCITEFIERLEQLEDKVGTTVPVMPHASDKAKVELRSDRSLRLNISDED